MIKFKNIRYKNFLSSGNDYTEIHLDKSPTTIITGDNGAGKSTILDALCWSLFNKPFRNIRKAQLINSINQKNTRVEIEFSIANSEFKIIRGTKPDIFEIWKNDKLLPQPGNSRDYQKTLEETILKLNYKSFTQIVVLGNASFTPFMQLTVRDRRDVIEDLLDIQIFSRMNVLLKDRISKNKQDKNTVNYEIKMINEQIKMQNEYLSKIQRDVYEQKKELKSEVIHWKEQLENSNNNISKYQKIVDELLGVINDPDKFQKQYRKVVSILENLHAKINVANKRADFFKNNDHCPTCKQIIEAKVKAEKIENAQKIMEEKTDKIGQMDKEKSRLKLIIEEINEKQMEITKYQQLIREEQVSQGSYNNNIERIKEKVIKLSDKEKESSNAQDSKKKIKEYGENLKIQEEMGEKLSGESNIYQIATDLLKDGGIKRRIIKQYIPIINKLVNKYLASLDFFVNFELDEEFHEVIRSRHRDEFSYSSFSEGEKMRIDLALLFTWRAIAKLKNSTNTNLLILDEVFDASLDTTGCDEFLKLLHEIGSDVNVFVISHKGDILIDKFRSQIRFEKVQNFSRIAPNN